MSNRGQDSLTLTQHHLDNKIKLALKTHPLRFYMSVLILGPDIRRLFTASLVLCFGFSLVNLQSIYIPYREREKSYMGGKGIATTIYHSLPKHEEEEVTTPNSKFNITRIR